MVKRDGLVADSSAVSTAALTYTAPVRRSFRLDRPDYRPTLEWAIIAFLSVSGLVAWLYAAVALAVGLLNGA